MRLMGFQDRRLLSLIIINLPYGFEFTYIDLFHYVVDKRLLSEKYLIMKLYKSCSAVLIYQLAAKDFSNRFVRPKFLREISLAE